MMKLLTILLLVMLCGCVIPEFSNWSDIPEKPVPEKPVPEKPVPEKPVPEKPVPEKPVPEKPVPDQLEESYSYLFVWKPFSDSNNLLAILLPAWLKYTLIKSFTVNGHEALSLYVADTNGNRPTFRFPVSGDKFGTNVKIVITLLDNTVLPPLIIPDGGIRYTHNFDKPTNITYTVFEHCVY